MSKFQIITIVVFVVGIVGGVLAFALFKGSTSSSSLPSITVWGTFPADTFNRYVSDIGATMSSPLSITYVQIDQQNFNNNFVNALALGQGPDAVLLPSDMMLSEQNKLSSIPFTVMPQATYFNLYIDEARVYMSSNGFQAIPFTVDPLVMYWNRDIFNAAGIAAYPKYWDEFTGSSLKPGLVQKLTAFDQNGNIRKSALAMGDFDKVSNAREILGTLLLQIGNPVTTTDGGLVVSAIKTNYAISPVTALQFFSQFADPTNANYSWNKGLPNDKTAFLSGTLATYFGYASELADIRAKNPNLNFDVAPMPQVRSGGQTADYARLYGFSLVRASSKLDSAYQIISILTSATNLQSLSKTMYLPTVRRDVIALGSTDPYITIFNQEALIAKNWVDANSLQSRQIFSNLIQSLTSGQKSVSQAIGDAGDQYDVILKSVQ